MYKRHFDRYKGIYQYWLIHDGPEFLLPADGCRGCGIEKGRKDNLALDTKRYLCENCKVADRWKMEESK